MLSFGLVPGYFFAQDTIGLYVGKFCWGYFCLGYFAGYFRPRYSCQGYFYTTRCQNIRNLEQCQCTYRNCDWVMAWILGCHWIMPRRWEMSYWNHSSWNWLLRARWSVLWSINKSLGTNLSYHDTYILVQYTWTLHNSKDMNNMVSKLGYIGK